MKRASFIMIFLLIIMISNMVKAATYSEILNSDNPIGMEIQVDPDDFEVRIEQTGEEDLFCLQYYYWFQAPVIYRVSHYVQIRGNTATDLQTGISVTNSKNAQFAWIVSHREGPDPSMKPSNILIKALNFSKAQWALYRTINGWYNEVGNYFGLNWSDPRNDGVAEAFQSDEVGQAIYKLQRAYHDWQIYSGNSQYMEYVYGSQEYANSIANYNPDNQTKPKDNTVKDNIKVDYILGNEYIRVGPFNWEFAGMINSVTLTGNNGAQPPIKIYASNATTEIATNQIESGKDFYISFRADSGITSITRLEGKGKSTSVSNIKNADIIFIEAVRGVNSKYPGNSQKLILTKIPPDTVPEEYIITNTEDIPLNTSFTIEKVDADDENIKLQDVGFKFYNKEIGKYLQFQFDANNEVTKINYVDTIEEATELLTDQRGKIELKNVLAGTYVVYETKNPDEEYETSMEGTTIVPENGNNYYIVNKKVYIRLSGYVWEDKQSEKMSVRNDLYKDDSNDSEDILVPGITVRLVDKTKTNNDRIVATTTTNNQGKYLFEKVLIDKIEDYYIEFEYDGLIYQNVNSNLNKENGSKAAEVDRQEFNNRFTEMIKGSSNTQVVADNGEKDNPRVNYNVTNQMTQGRELAIKDKDATENTEILATTEGAGFDITYAKGQDEIENINLGIYKRAQADLAIQTEIEQVKAEINGYGHIYQYGPKYNINNATEVENSWNLGIRYENKYKGTYERPIYKADAEYTNSADPSKELKLSVTYKISLRNQSTIYGKVNSIAGYYDSRYEIVKVGTGVDNSGNITGELKYEKNSNKYSNMYSRIDIDTSNLGVIEYSTSETKVTQKYLYVQFNLSRDIILEMLNSNNPKDALNFTSEIASYTSYSDKEGKKLYAAYDIDSVPDNCEIGNLTTYEDDTDKASSLALTIANARTITGNVFEDLQEENDKNIAEGNGIQDGEEKNLKNVKVQLIDDSEDGNVVDVCVDKDIWAEASFDVNEQTGDYAVYGFIPGKYKIRFVWGDDTERIIEGEDTGEDINVENFKSTIIDKNVYDKMVNDEEYYKKSDITNGRSLAIDNTEMRTQIDKGLKDYNYSSDAIDSEGNKITKINADTCKMNFEIEYDGTDIENTIFKTSNAKEDKSGLITFEIGNINFGIIRRPKQNIDIVKRVSNFKFILATGQVLVDASIDKEGNMTGATNYLSYIGNPNTPESSILRLEIDENLIQSSTVQITYDFDIKNTSQSDYISSDYGYYKFGEDYYEGKQQQKDIDIIEMSPSIVVDYLSETSQYDVNNSNNIDSEWHNLTLNDINVSDEVKNALLGNDNNNKLENYQIYMTEKYKNSKLKPIYYKTGNSIKQGGNELSLSISTGQPISSTMGSNYENQVEIILVSKDGGGRLTSTPGNYIPNRKSYETPDTDDGTSEEIVIIPSTGENKNIILPISIIIVSLIILGVGTYVIREKVIKNK